MMVTGVVNDQMNASSWPVMADQLFKKCLEAGRVEYFFLTGDQPSIVETDGSKEADFFTGGSVQDRRVSFFRRDPHSATGTVLLKVAFIQTPEVDVFIGGETSEFFYMPVAIEDPIGQ